MPSKDRNQLPTPVVSEPTTPVVLAPVDLLRAALREQGLPPRPGQEITEQTQESSPSLVSTMGQSLRWAQSIGYSLLSTRLALNIASQVLPLAIAGVSATAVPLAIKVRETGQNLDTLYGTMLGLLGLGLAQVAIGATERYVQTVSSNKIFRRFHGDLLDAGTDLSPALLDTPSVQNKITKVRENLYSLGGNVGALLGLCGQTIGLMATAASLVPISSTLSATVALLGVLRVVHSIRHGSDRKVAEDILAEPRRQMWYSSWPLRDPEGLLGVKDLLRAKALAKANVREMAAIDAAEELVEKRQILRGLTGDIGVTATGVTASAVGLLAYTAGAMSLEAALYLTAATTMFAAGVNNFTSNIGIWVSTRHLVDDARSLFTLAASTKARESELPAQQIKRYSAAPGIEINNVSVVAERIDAASGQVQTSTILKDIQLEIKPGEFLGIVGPSGAGKTTLVKLLLGALEPSSGQITIDKRPLGDIPLAELRANACYLPQKYWNYPGRSLRGNISIGTPIWEESADITPAVRDSGLEEMMRVNHFSLETVIGPEFKNGRSLSGGEQQVVALARSLAKAGRIIVLDEPTAKLDPDTAERVIDHLRGLNDCTRLLVSHDMGLVRKCDRILVMSKIDAGDEQSPGCIEACGTHDELLKISPTYRRFFGKQAAKFSDS